MADAARQEAADDAGVVVTQQWTLLKDKKPAMHQAVVTHTDTHHIEVMIYTGDKFYAAMPPNAPCGCCCPERGLPPFFGSFVPSDRVTHWAEIALK